MDGQLGAQANRKQADGFATKLAPIIGEMRGRRLSLREIAAELSAQGIRTPRGASGPPVRCATCFNGSERRRRVRLRRISRPPRPNEPIDCMAKERTIQVIIGLYAMRDRHPHFTQRHTADQRGPEIAEPFDLVCRLRYKPISGSLSCRGSYAAFNRFAACFRSSGG